MRKRAAKIIIEVTCDFFILRPSRGLRKMKISRAKSFFYFPWFFFFCSYSAVSMCLQCNELFRDRFSKQWIFHRWAWKIYTRNQTVVKMGVEVEDEDDYVKKKFFFIPFGKICGFFLVYFRIFILNYWLIEKCDKNVNLFTIGFIENFIHLLILPSFENFGFVDHSQ